MATDFGFAHLANLLAQIGHHLGLDRQAVAVPARHIRGVEAGHRLELDHDILEDLVDDMAHVDIPVGVGRAVVQRIERGPLPGRPDLAVDVLLGPTLTHLGLALDQVGFHGETGLG